MSSTSARNEAAIVWGQVASQLAGTPGTQEIALAQPATKRVVAK